MKTKRRQGVNCKKRIRDKNGGLFSSLICRHLGFVSSEKVLSMSDSQKVLVHSGMVCARLHALRGSQIRAAKIVEIENKIYKGEKHGVVAIVASQRTRRVKLTVGEIRALFDSADCLPRTTFMIV